MCARVHMRFFVAYWRGTYFKVRHYDCVFRFQVDHACRIGDDEKILLMTETERQSLEAHLQLFNRIIIESITLKGSISQVQTLRKSGWPGAWLMPQE